jgi:hypothetical protein
MKINFKQILVFSLWLIIFLVLLKNSFNYLDPDLGWHLQIGKQIITEKNVPNLEYYNFPLLGIEWVDHEWLLNTINYFIYNNFGYFLLNIFYVLLIIITLFIIQKIIDLNYPAFNKLLLLLIFLAGILSARPSLGIRLQEFSLLFTAILFLIIEKYSKTNKINHFYLAPALFLLWANSHGSFILGLGLFFAYLLLLSIPSLWNKIFSWLKIFEPLPITSLQNKISLWLLFFVSILTTLFTPYGIKLYELLSDYSSTFYFSHILEWLPAWKPPIIHWQIIYTAITVSFFAIAIISAKKSDNKINPWYFFLIFFFFAFTVKSRRHFPLFFIASLPLLIYFFDNQRKIPSKIFKGRYVQAFIKTYITLGIILGSALIILTTNFTDSPFTNEKFCEGLPCEAVEFLKSKNLINTNFFNPYHWGGYLAWQWPEKLLFIDGRFPQLPYQSHTYLQEYFTILEKNNVEAKINEHKIDLIMLSIAKPFEPDWIERYIFGYTENYYRDPNLEILEYLNSAKEWELIYNDDISLVYSLEKSSY